MLESERTARRIGDALAGLDAGEEVLGKGWINDVVRGLSKRDRNRILRAALRSYIEAETLKPYQAELIKLQDHLEASGRKAIILFDGRDASGKGGTIRRVTRYMNEKHYRTVALGKPTEWQQSELHMKRYIEQLPRSGEIVLFDRSWYNRALVEPVMGFCTQKQHVEFMKTVNDYERSFVSDDQTSLIKLYFSVSKAEQARRFARRKHDPLRMWKLSEVDLQAQDLWEEFTAAKFELLKWTHTQRNPWYVIRSDNKARARLETIKLILREIPYEGRNTSLDFSPNPEVVIPGDTEANLMRRQRRDHGSLEI